MLIFSILFSLFRIILNAAKMDEGAILLAFSVPSFPYRFWLDFGILRSMYVTCL